MNMQAEQAHIDELQKQAKSLIDTSNKQQQHVHAPATVDAATNKEIAANKKIGTNQQEFPQIYVNGIAIEAKDIGRELQYHKASSQREAIFLAAQALTIKELLKQAYLDLVKGDKTEDEALIFWQTQEEQAISQLLNVKVQTSEPSKAQCHTYYDNNTEKFITAPLMQVSHILLAAHPADGDERLSVRAKASELIDQIKDAPDSFTELALEHSACPSKEAGGSLGQISSGDTVPEFEKVLFKLEKGLHGAPIESRYGWHIVRVDEKEHGQQLEFVQVHNKIAQQLSQHEFNQNLLDFLYVLVNDATIEGIELNLDQENVFRG